VDDAGEVDHTADSAAVGLDIRLLGPLELRVGPRPVALPARAERELLALLALRAGRVVPVERLVDALWGDPLPANPANALQLRVSKLRKALVGAGASPRVLVTRSPGYLLDVAPERVDVARFTSAVTRARSLADARDLIGALEGYRRAAATWGGLPLTGMTEAVWAQEEARQLESTRLAAAEEWLTLEVDAGRHGEALETLDVLVREHPLHERLHALRMLALYRSGQQAAALEAFQHARRLLDEELGLDPSPELRDLERAILRHEVEPAAAGAWPPRTLVEPNLPARRASFLGRDREIADLLRLLGPHRLVTVTGPGGAGKTALAVEAAREATAAGGPAGRFPDGAWFVGLAGVAAGHDVVAAVSAAFGLPPAESLSGESADDRVARQLASRGALLILDNCEHVLDATAALIDRLLSRCPRLHVLATSREAMVIAGEVQYVLPPLDAPPVAAEPDTVSSYPAVQLFLERAAAVGASREPDPAELPAVARICRELDGMPLAIELAAARTRTLPVAVIAERLEDRFRLLTSGSRTAERRHRTLHATVEWSHQLLDEPERVLLRRLAVFRAPFTFESAAEVCADDRLERGGVVELTSRLMERSLVIRADDGRLRLLETVRQFAHEQLEAAGEADAVQVRNLRRLTALVERAAPALRGHDQRRWLGLLQDAQDELRAALTFCADRPGVHGRSGLRLASRLGWFWYLGDHEEGRRQLARLVEVVDVDDDPEGYALALEAFAVVQRPSACVVHPSVPCADAAREAIAVFRRLGDEDAAARAAVLLAVEGARGTGTAGSLELLDAAEARFLAGGDEWQLALSLFVRMEVLLRTDELERALACGREASRRYARLGDLWGVSAVEAHLSHDLFQLGRTDEALAAGRRALAIAREVGLTNTIQMMAAEVGVQLLAAGDDAGAERELLAARTIARRFGFRVGDGLASTGEGHLAGRRGDLGRAAALYREAVETLRETGSLVYLVPVTSSLGYVREQQDRLDEAEACHRDVLAIARAMPDPWIVATAWEGLAAVALARGDHRRAQRLFAAATEVRRRSRRPPSALQRPHVERTARGLDRAVDGLHPTGTARSVASAVAALDHEDAVAVQV
jgi:predicted ATPase/DNA-binding SARP family transcriptional activator